MTSGTHIGPSEISRGSKFKVIGVALASLSFFGAIGLYFAKPVIIRITEDQAQAVLNAKIGERQSGNLGVGVTPDRLDIDFSGDNRLVLNTEMTVDGFGRSARATGQLRSGIRYRAPKIYLHDVDGSDLSFDAAPETASELSDLSTVLKDRLKREREKVQSEDAGDAFDSLLSKNEDRLRDMGAAAIQTAYGSIPIYDLRDAGVGGSVASLALQDVRFEDGVAIVTLGPRQALIKLLVMLALGLGAILWTALSIMPGIVIDKAINRLTKKNSAGSDL